MFYPCGAHAHATWIARELCQGPPQFDSIPDLQLEGWIYTQRTPEPKQHNER